MFKSIILSLFRIMKLRWIIFCIVTSFIFGCYLAAIPISEIQIPNIDTNKIQEPKQLTAEKTEKKNTSSKKLAILVPFRDRFEELLKFVPHMYSFLQKQQIPFSIFVIQQTDKYRFNRASLINVGFLYTKDKYDYIAMHDVDLLPLNDQLVYNYPDEGPLHMSAPALHPKYHYSTYIGGILLIKREHFELVDGMSNKYWGWGLEDDEFYIRLKDAGLVVRRPSNITTGQTNTFWHNHEVNPNRRRDMRKCYNQHEETRRRDRKTGVHDVNYSIQSVHQLRIDNLPLTVVNVALGCNKTATPWCQCPEVKKIKDNKSKKNR